jgi:hypothetical protein
VVSIYRGFEMVDKMPGCSWLVIPIQPSDLDELEAQAAEKGVPKNALAREDILDGNYWRKKDGVNWKEKE